MNTLTKLKAVSITKKIAELSDLVSRLEKWSKQWLIIQVKLIKLQRKLEECLYMIDLDEWLAQNDMTTANYVDGVLTLKAV